MKKLDDIFKVGILVIGILFIAVYFLSTQNGRYICLEHEAVIKLLDTRNGIILVFNVAPEAGSRILHVDLPNSSSTLQKIQYQESGK